LNVEEKFPRLQFTRWCRHHDHEAAMPLCLARTPSFTLMLHLQTIYNDMHMQLLSLLLLSPLSFLLVLSAQLWRETNFSPQIVVHSS